MAGKKSFWEHPAFRAADFGIVLAVLFALFWLLGTH